nr:alpha/beta hydrolase [Saprospiraceae bacterium]
MKKLIEIQIKVIAVLLLLVFFSCNKEQDEDINNPDGTSNLSDTTLLDVPYGGHLKQVYDIYLPAKRNTTTPVVLMIHGGAWKAGQKEDFNIYLNRIKTKWEDAALVNMNYRLANNADNIHHNEIMADISAVVSDLISKMNDYQISSKIGVIGASAGGQLAMIYAYKYDPNIKCIGNIFGPSIINDWSWYNSQNPWLGGYTGDILTEYVGQPWDTTAYKAVSPYWNITSTSQPTIIFHGSLDPIVPVYQSQWMHGKLNSLGVVNEYHEYLAFHSFDNNQSNEVITKLVRFFKEHIK